ncbi:MAG: hypothetical protein GY913_17870 [Proteobacteria bacterium]|nr:hypothetical protein [Pseudomonadota bacterium]MCP4918775.1 hypothetical protein [Pseudomonadota bacterium]
MILLLLACQGEWVTLEPYDNPHEGPEQPHRDKPLEVVVHGERAFVSLQGTVDDPGTHVAVVDLASGELVDRVEVGAGPTGLTLHPDGEHLVVFHRFTNFLSLISLKRLKEVERVEVDFYTVEGAFDDEGRLWTTNRWRDATQVFDTDLQLVGSVPVGSNPRDLVVGSEVAAVAALTGGTVSIVDLDTVEETHRVDLGAPASGLALVEPWLVVATLSASTHHLPEIDGTPNVNFQDLQNELAVIDTRTGEEAWRYTSDSICCFDYRDVDPEDADRQADLLPDESLWIVGGALPEQVTAHDGSVWVTYSASNQVQELRVNPATGALEPITTWDSAGHAPHGVAVTDSRVLVTNRLSESLGIHDHSGELKHEVVVGDVEGGAFPATDAELGELVNFVTAPISIDGDQSCAHCHREGGNIDKAFSMPLTAYGGRGSRMTMAYRGAADTRPWFFESSMDETNFKPVLNEFARIENFCCSDYTLWDEGAPVDCATQSYAECDEPNPSSADGFDPERDRGFEHERPTAYSTRDEHVLAAVESLVGRRESFGDGLYYEDPITREQEPIALDFDGVTRAIGQFLLAEPRLLPNPNPPDRGAVERGEALFESSGTGCAVCHPAPTFAVSLENNPMNLPLRMGPVVSPNRAEDGTNLDLIADGFVEIFPQSEMDTCDEICGELCLEDDRVCDDLRDVYLGVPSLRGIWDRAPSMLHDGRAQGLREVICTPGHPALEPGETGFNERDGVPDTHGGASHLTAAEVEDLVAFLESL